MKGFKQNKQSKFTMHQSNSANLLRTRESHHSHAESTESDVQVSVNQGFGSFVDTTRDVGWALHQMQKTQGVSKLLNELEFPASRGSVLQNTQQHQFGLASFADESYQDTTTPEEGLSSVGFIATQRQQNPFTQAQKGFYSMKDAAASREVSVRVSELQQSPSRYVMTTDRRTQLRRSMKSDAQLKIENEQKTRAALLQRLCMIKEQQRVLDKKNKERKAFNQQAATARGVTWQGEPVYEDTFRTSMYQVSEMRPGLYPSYAQSFVNSEVSFPPAQENNKRPVS